MTDTKKAGPSAPRIPAHISPNDIPSIHLWPARGAMTRREFALVILGRPLFIAVIVADLLHLDTVACFFAKQKLRFDKWRNGY